MNILFENPKYDSNVEMIARTCEFFDIPFYITNSQNFRNKLSAGVLKNKKIPILNNPELWEGRIIATSDKFTLDINNINLLTNDLVIVGNETCGISKELENLSNIKVGISSKGIVPCLNVSAFVAFIIGLNIGNVKKTKEG